jgi:hypothetical protein
MHFIAFAPSKRVNARPSNPNVAALEKAARYYAACSTTPSGVCTACMPTAGTKR